MADIILEQGQTLPPETQTKYRELADGSYALVVAPEETEISQINGVAPEMDTVTRAQATIDVPHLEVHEGEMFISTYKSADASPIADDAAIMLHIFTGALLFPHLTFSASAGGDAELQWYEGTIFSANGTPMAEVAMNRARVGIATAQVFHTPTVLDVGGVLQDGFEMLTAFMPGGRMPFASGGVLRPGTEWPLARETHYMARLINRSGNAAPLGLGFQWYETSRA